MSYLTDGSSKWFSFYPKFSNSLYVEKAGYFDERPLIHTSITQLIAFFTIPFLITHSILFLLLLPFLFIGWGKLMIRLPIKTGIQACDNPAWGLVYQDDMILIYLGERYELIDMPWKMEWVKKSIKMNYGWYDIKPNDLSIYREQNNIGSYEWIKSNRWTVTYPFIDRYDDTVVNAKLGMSVNEWRPKWLVWTHLFSKTISYIDVHFDAEVGKEKDSYKGGVCEFNYEIKKYESVHDCLKRMEREYIF